jgi:paraquat-inducible protein A
MMTNQTNIIIDKDIDQSLCLHCGKLQDYQNDKCYRCKVDIAHRKHDSIRLTMIYLFCAIMFLIPANLIPIMTVTNLSAPEHGTIIEGIIRFFNSGNYVISIIILIASIVVPIIKITSLIYMLLIIKLNQTHLVYNATKLYRVLEFIGKYSMIDIFVLVLLVTSVHFGGLSVIDVAPAAFAFGVSVIFTMLATNSFDTRLMWDMKREIEDIDETEEIDNMK